MTDPNWAPFFDRLSALRREAEARAADPDWAELTRRLRQVCDWMLIDEARAEAWFAREEQR